MDMASLAVKYRGLTLKRIHRDIDIWFLNRCIEKEVTPVFAKIKTSKNVPYQLVRRREGKLLRSEISKYYRSLKNQYSFKVSC